MASLAHRGRGQRLTTSERATVERALRRHTSWSDLAIANLTDTSDKTVKRIRLELQADDEIEEYVGRGPERRLSLRVAEDPDHILDRHLPVTGEDFDPVTTGMFTVGVSIGDRTFRCTQQFSLGVVREGLTGWGQAVRRMANQLHRDPGARDFWVRADGHSALLRTSVRTRITEDRI